MDHKWSNRVCLVLGPRCDPFVKGSHMKVERMKNEAARHRVDVDGRTKLVLDDLVGRGLFRDQQDALTAAVAALQLQLVSETYTGEYDDDGAQEAMDEIQLATSDR